ncbi:choline transporter protein 1-like [Primulina eburnea]|uniref:choline transporter protein 1-like n=1 Tax=Primulina eburnea TaxID=1245227 RepID=UPI003C6C0F00
MKHVALDYHFVPDLVQQSKLWVSDVSYVDPLADALTKPLSAGWLGNDAISPIIGEHDLYYHVPSRGVNNLHPVAVLMTVVMIISLLSSIAIVRRVLMATSVLKVAAKVIGDIGAMIIFLSSHMPY